MKGVEIHDTMPPGVLVAELADLLETLSPRSLDLQWEIRNVEVSGQGGATVDDLYAIEDDKERVTGTRLLEVARNILQTLEGTFVGLDRSGRKAMVIKNIRGSLWEVFGEPQDLDRLKTRFKDVRDAEYEEPYN